jgi:recombinational DNA repair protein (RecF pathway)
VKVLTAVWLEPQIRIAHYAILRKKYPVRAVERNLLNAAGIAPDSNCCGSSAKPLQLDMPVWIAVGQKLEKQDPNTEIPFPTCLRKKLE